MVYKMANINLVTIKHQRYTRASVYPGSVGVSASIDHPKVERHVTYKEDEKILGEYDFTKGDGYDKPYADDDAYDGG